MKRHIRYYDASGKYLDHGRMIYNSLPKVGEVIHPFHTINGVCNWKVVETKDPVDDEYCYEIYVEDLGVKKP